jgi:hypothetical protein
MLNTHFNNTLNPQDFDIFVGLDVDKRSISISVFLHGGFLKSQILLDIASQLIYWKTVKTSAPCKNC